MKDKNLNNKNMDSGTYDVIKSRLAKQGQDLKQRLEVLNTARKDIFGSIDTKLLSSARIITENNCIPRDMAPVGNRFIFGYNVHMGLKTKIEIEDVFSVYRYKNGEFSKEGYQLIDDPQFTKDFDDLYRYYKGTFFAKFTILGPYYYMVFQTGDSAIDIKVFKWLIESDKLTYVDNRSEHEVRFIGRNEFDFVRTTRDDHRSGIHPHVSIRDKVFVETVGGDLTIKIEDNTESGKGIYAEDVDDPDQNLDDALIEYADLGQLIILKIRPYKENNDRYFIYNAKLKNVVRIDSIKDTCMLLPGGHGLIFPKGYYLQNGEHKLFDVPSDGSVFDQVVTSSNGEDYQYMFYNLETGIYMVYSYNVIEQSIDTPIVCSGYSHFSNGQMIVFKQGDEPRKNHMIQIWQTPYVGEDYVTDKKDDSELYNIGNKDIVRCMASCRGVSKMIDKGESYQSVYVDIVKETEDIIDSYFWLDKSQAGNLLEVLKEIKETASFAVGEFEKVLRIQKATADQLDSVTLETEDMQKKLQFGTFDSVDQFVNVLAQIRQLRGRIVSLRDLRYIDLAIVDGLDEEIKTKNDEFSLQCVEFLIKPEGLAPYESKVTQLTARIPQVTKSSEGKALDEDMDQASGELELLMDIVSNFKIDDPTVTTAIIDKISGLFSKLNNAKAKLKTKVDDFNKAEMLVQFNAQMKLLGQAVVNYMDISDTEEKCDAYLNKIMIQLQELEGKFSEFNDYIVKIDEKREDVYSAFESRKQAILDKLNRRIVSLFESAERILKGIENRLKAFNNAEAINGYLATDLMAEKVRDIMLELRDLGDVVKADEVSSRFKTLKENALRQLKDKQDLFLDGENIIRLGNHKFSVNTKAIDLSVVKKDDGLYYHISGTDFWEKMEGHNMDKYAYVFDQVLPSENQEVYRGEYLAYSVYIKVLKGQEINGILYKVEDLYQMSPDNLGELVRKYMEAKYQEGYTKGVHDGDAILILKELLNFHIHMDLLIYGYEARALAKLYWYRIANDEDKKLLSSRLEKVSKIQAYFKKKPDLSPYIEQVTDQMEIGFGGLDLFKKLDYSEAATYLCQEILMSDHDGGDINFIQSLEAKNILEEFYAYLRECKAFDAFKQGIKESKDDLVGQFYLASHWLNAYMSELDYQERSMNQTSTQAVKKFQGVKTKEILDGYTKAELEGIMTEVKALAIEYQGMGRLIQLESKVRLEGLVASHQVIDSGVYTFSYNAFMDKLNHFDREVVPDYNTLNKLKKDLSEDFKNHLHLDDFKPRVLTSFVRNQLIDKVYLPLIGNNLAKQIGEAGDNKRTDLMGLLLLVSPPGYGKTTLMEYVASRLGIILVKVNGPSLGHEVTSLDPDQARHFSAKEELRKLNLALKMGNNVMIYIDDIQHCNPEFLQKFISLCDGQRKIEGTYKGQSQSYDLRGKKVAVVMAGNPYTESGDKFTIPDMLANRADVYNLGDMLGENEEAFKLSYVENAITSNPSLSKLAARDKKDLYALLDLASGADRESLEFESDFSVDELTEYTELLKKMFRVRDVVLKVNMEYIRSAAQAEEYRHEPAFKLQGSYRNMNKIAEKLVSIMNDEELDKTILRSYENDCQTLTSGAEANILRWKELVELASDEEVKRLGEIRDIYHKNKLVKGDDQVGQAVMVLSNLTDNIEEIKHILAKN